MARHTLIACLAGLAIFVALSSLGTILNFNKQRIPAPPCENWQYVDYVGCDPRSGFEYYTLGWPQKIYCAFDGKFSCSPWSDFLRHPRFKEKHEVLKQNMVLITAGSFVLGSLTTSVILLRDKCRNKNANHRN